MLDPVAMVAKGARKGYPVEDFQPIWNSAAMRIARSAWVDCGLEVFLRKDVPYGATSSGRLSEDAVQLLLETGPKNQPCRFLEIGSGSGIFAKLFLDSLKLQAPEIYKTCTYIVTDGSAIMLESQSKYGVLAEHADQIETRVFDAGAPWPKDFEAAFDGVFASYILDSLPIDILSVGESGVRQMQARCVLPVKNDALEDALKIPGNNHLAPFLPIAKNLQIQTRHFETANLPYADALPMKKGDDTPMVHCHGALACVENIANALRSGGFAMLSDYGTLVPREPSEQIEFQNFGASAALAVNFHQLDSWFAEGKTAYLKPVSEEGHLITRVLYNGDGSDLFELVDLLFGLARQQALRLPVEAAREMLRANAFETARQLYSKAMALQPRNWSLAEEVSELLLLSAKDYKDAISLAEFGLSLNPIGPNLYRIIAEARYHLGDISGAEDAIAACLRLSGASPQARLLQARIQVKSEHIEGALISVAKGLAMDKEADQREALIQLQNEILVNISQNAREDLLAEVNRTRNLDALTLRL
ncbi:MAG: SAM-dependent methyltransferase [Rhodobacteraceae bacterium]|nr:SAM-dependent methyltransferase [Paracoccaceae bacterium]